MCLNEAIIAAYEIQMKLLRQELIYCGMYPSIKCNLIINGFYHKSNDFRFKRGGYLK
jgi:hypothetical protein